METKLLDVNMLWFPALQLLEETIFRESLFHAIGRNEVGEEVTLPCNRETAYRAPFRVFTAQKISSRLRFWELTSGHRIDRIPTIEFPVQIIGSVAIVIDYQKSQREEDRRTILRGQMYHIGEIVTCAKELDTPLFLICLREDLTPTPRNELISETLHTPHVEINNYHMSELGKLKEDLTGFLSSLKVSLSKPKSE